MKAFPYATKYINEVFGAEKERFDYIFIRPLLLVLYFFTRFIVFPLKFIFHRNPYGFESWCIDFFLGVGLKYFASRDAVELLVRHVQIEPLLYRHLLIGHDIGEDEESLRKPLNGIFGSYDFESISDMIVNGMTVAHDELSYEIVDRFDKNTFLKNLDVIRKSVPVDHNSLSKEVLKINQQHTLGWFGCTNVVMMIVFTITIFADLKTAVKALNSFGSDSIVLWAMKRIYIHDAEVSADLDFYMQVDSNRSHYNSSVFFSDPSQYLYYHVMFDEFMYDTLVNRSPLVG